MATGGSGSGAVGRDLALLAGGGAAAALGDEALLARFLDGPGAGAEAAFEALVHRHGPMVRAICRRALRDPGDAGDAFQATFLVLARRAGTVRLRGGSLAPWLHGVGVRVAGRARTVEGRRRSRERTNSPLPEVAGRPGEPDPEVRRVIDEELGRLPSRYGSALILFHLEGLGHEEAAERLGCPVGTVRSRLSRGRDLLRDRLARRGLAPSIAFALGTLADLEIQASTARPLARLAAGRATGGSVPPAVAELVAGASRMITLRKFAPWSALGLLGAAAGLALAQGPAPTPAAPASPPLVARAAPASAPMPPAPEPAAGGSFDAFAPFVVKTEPATGSTDVDPALAEIRVTFSKEMQDGNWSWVTLSKETFPEIVGQPRYQPDKRTCVVAVKLEAGRTYAAFLNSPKFNNFRDLGGQRAVPYLLVFKTRK